MSTLTSTSFSRTAPYLAHIVRRTRLSKEGSTKETFHIELDVDVGALSFQPGDSVGILPQNPKTLVDKMLSALRAPAKLLVTEERSNVTFPLEEFLKTRANLTKLTARMARLLSPEKVSSLSKEELASFLEGHEPLDLLQEAPKGALNLKDLPSLFAPQLPRFYSIASSPLVYPSRIHLTVTVPTYTKNGEVRRGIASSFLCFEAAETTPIPLYVQPSHHFALPEDPGAPIIMIGPGTGIAPFRAFLQHRLHLRAPGKNWLFFGECHRKLDFYYEEELGKLQEQGALKLTEAFSRDQEHKIYVQDRLLQEGKEVWQWLQEGAFLYVCGDAKKMAKAVDEALGNLICTHGNLSHDAARAHLALLHKEKRYLRDIY